MRLTKKYANLLHSIRSFYVVLEFYFHQCGSMFMKDGVNIGKWNLNEQIRRAEEIQHELEELYG